VSYPTELRDLRPEEQSAALRLKDRVGASEIIPRDLPGAPEGTYDFDLIVADKVIAVEVTTAADGVAKSLWEAVEQLQWEEPTLSLSWGITVIAAASMNKLRRRGPELWICDRLKGATYPPS